MTLCFAWKKQCPCSLGISRQMATAQQGELCAAEEIYDVMSQRFQSVSLSQLFSGVCPHKEYEVKPLLICLSGGTIISCNGE